jgi:cytochrome c biogenesis protein CcmG/thiol:disulfide interchange protein DsbE
MAQLNQAMGADSPSEETLHEDETVWSTPVKPGARVARWAAFLVSLVSIVLVVIFGSRFGTDPRLVESPLLGKPAPSWELPYLEKEGVLSSTDLLGQIVVVNFWASWCVACRAEHDDLMRTARAYEDRDVRFVGIVFQDEPEDSIRFLDELGRGYDNVTDEGSRTAIEFGVFGIPETFFVDAQGLVAAKIAGESNTELLSSTIEAMLRGEVPESRTDGRVQTAPGK